MIVPVSSEKYDNLFAEATEFLKTAKDKDGNLLFQDVPTIDSLNAYYGHMRDFFQASGAHEDNRRGYKYIMMPLDQVGEEAFEINLNSRIITVPTAFSKIAGVQADQMAELIIFSADRYFDYMDLANTLIYVQWQLPDKQNTVGATEITIKDLESAPGKIRFAWPLYNTITKHSGIVKFSIRFFVFDENNKLAYSLNTLEANLIIKAALDPSEKIDPEPWGDLFTKAIINSQYTNDGQIPPEVPSFDAPGVDMTIVPYFEKVDYADENAFKADERIKFIFNETTEEYEVVKTFEATNTYYVQISNFVRCLDEAAEAKKTQVAKLGEDTLTLQAQAIVTDSGQLTYQWKFRPDGSNEWTEIQSNVTEVYKPAILPVDPITKEHYLDFRDAYYTDTQGTRYTGWTVPTDTDGNYNNSLYEKYTQFTIPAREVDEETGELEEVPDVVGTYVIEAKNTISNMNKKKWSTYCYLPGPADIEFANPMFSMEDGKLQVNLKIDNNTPAIRHLWFRDSLSKEGAITKANGEEPTSSNALSNMDQLLPGWYATRVVADLNRKIKVKGTPDAQVIYATPKIDSVMPEGGAEKTAFNVPLYGTQTLSVVATVPLPDGFDDAKDISNDLYRNLTYKWQYRYSDSGSKWYDITDKMIGNTNEHLIAKYDEKSNSITVRNIKELTAYNYRCIVTNTLGTESKSMTLSDEYMFLVY